MTTVFSKIIRRELPAEILFENDHLIAFKDINPVAPVHLLLVPKKEIRDLQSLAPEDLYLVGELIAAAQQLAEQLGISNGYRLLTNNGAAAGQAVFHLHFHLIGGAPLAPIG
jgi:histidine triad (HIT) family protein